VRPNQQDEHPQLKNNKTKQKTTRAVNTDSDHYLHRVPGKLVHYDGVLWLVKGSGDMLDEETKCFLVFLGRHWFSKRCAVAEALGPQSWRDRRERCRLYCAVDHAYE
jgi:hypothetical protein